MVAEMHRVTATPAPVLPSSLVPPWYHGASMVPNGMNRGAGGLTRGRENRNAEGLGAALQLSACRHPARSAPYYPLYYAVRQPASGQAPNRTHTQRLPFTRDKAQTGTHARDATAAAQGAPPGCQLHAQGECTNGHAQSARFRSGSCAVLRLRLAAAQRLLLGERVLLAAAVSGVGEVEAEVDEEAERPGYTEAADEAAAEGACVAGVGAAAVVGFGTARVVAEHALGDRANDGGGARRECALEAAVKRVDEGALGCGHDLGKDRRVAAGTAPGREHPKRDNDRAVQRKVVCDGLGREAEHEQQREGDPGERLHACSGVVRPVWCCSYRQR